MRHRFTIFVDESGDEGFTFRDPPERKGSSDWLVVSAVITMSAQQKAVIDFARQTREAIGIAAKKPLHWTELNHERRVRVYAEMAAQNYRYVSILVNKRAIKDPEVFKPRGRLYYYAVRLLARTAYLGSAEIPPPSTGSIIAKLKSFSSTRSA